MGMAVIVVQVIASDPSTAKTKRLSIEVDLEWTVNRLKRELEKQADCPASRMKLIFRGALINDGGDTLRNAGLHATGYTLFVAPAAGKAGAVGLDVGRIVRAAAACGALLLVAACVWHNGGSILRARREQWMGGAALVLLVAAVRRALESARERKRMAAADRAGVATAAPPPANPPGGTKDAEFPDDISAMMLGCGAG